MNDMGFKALMFEPYPKAENGDILNMEGIMNLFGFTSNKVLTNYRPRVSTVIGGTSMGSSITSNTFTLYESTSAWASTAGIWYNSNTTTGM